MPVPPIMSDPVASFVPSSAFTPSWKHVPPPTSSQRASRFRQTTKRVARPSFPLISLGPQQSPQTSSSQNAVPFAPPTSDVWELDFYSRPVVGFDGKKLWELIITDASGTFEYIETVPNSLVNSRELRKRVESAIKTAVRRPSTIRFFRTQMFNMIQIALSELDIDIAPTRKTYALYKLLKLREETVYRDMPGYKPSPAPSSSNALPSFGSFSFSVSKPLPDALRCEKFAFGSFPLAQLNQFFDEADTADYCGDRYPVDDDTPDDLTVPGLIVFSRRAKALAAWINGVDLAFVRTVMEQREVVLECGLDTVYRFVQIDATLKDDVRNFESLKLEAKGLHFLAVQDNPEADEVEGMWLLCEQ